MGTIILAVAFVIEVAFAAYCILTKSNQRRLWNFIGIGAFGAFVLFTLASVIQWSFRWYALGALLLVWAALGARSLLRKQPEKDDYQPGAIIGRALGTLLLLALVVVPALLFPESKQPAVTGKYEVATVNYTFTDANRIETFTHTGENRKVNVEFWYPKNTEGKYPLVVFSHGGLGTKTGNASTFMELASNGYVVCSIDHPYHSLLTIDTNGNRTLIDSAYLQEFMDVDNGKYDGATIFKLEHEWMRLRTTDINFVLDTILRQAQDAGSGQVYQLIDPDKIGLMGHSLGGESSAQVARERNDIGAVINLDADLGGEYLAYVNGKEVLNEQVYPVPILTIFSDTLVKLIDAVPDANTVVAVKHVTATAPNAFEVHLTGTDHMSMTDVPLVMPFLVTILNSAVPKAGGQEVDALSTIEKMNAIVLQFFNVYLKGQGTFTYSGAY